MPFNKFEPHRPFNAKEEDMTPVARRRVFVLKWATWASTGFLLLGYVFIAFWLWQAA